MIFFVKAEKNVIWNAPIMMFTVYTCIILISWFGAKMICCGFSYTTGELMSLLAYCMNILMSLMMLFDGFRHDFHEYGKYAPYCGSAE